MAAVDLTQEELALIKMLLNKEEIETRIQIHHARRSFEYRDYLKARETELHSLQDKISHLITE